MNIGRDRLANNLAKRVAKVRRRVSVYPEGSFERFDGRPD
jgi:hypothetical protein